MKRKIQDNALVEWLRQVILNMLATKDLANKVFDYIYPWDETLAYIAWAIRASCHRIIQATQGQAVFGRDMILNLVLVVDWRVITAGKHQQVDIENVKNPMWVTNDYTIGNIVYVEMTGIWRKLDYSKHWLYRITGVFTNGTGWFQWGN